MDTYTDIYAFLKAHENEVFHYWVYRRAYTPYEQQKCFSDESVFEDIHAVSGYIKECIPLGDGELLLGFQVVDDCDPFNAVPFDFVEYYKLSEIRLRRTLKNGDNH